MAAITRTTVAIRRVLSDLATEPTFTVSERAEALAGIRASCEYHIGILATEAELTARGDFFVAGGIHTARGIRE